VNILPIDEKVKLTIKQQLIYELKRIYFHK